jgi:hypothetical protein
VKPTLKLFFDECVSSPRLIRALQQFYTDVDGNCEAEFVRLQERFVSGEGDEAWLNQLSGEGGWIVITKDRGKSGGPKLPSICPQLKITHVAMIGLLEQANVEAWKQAFVDVWQTLKLAPLLPPGTKIKFRYVTTEPPRAALFVGNSLLKCPEAPSH